MTMAAGRAVIDIYPSMKGFKSSVNSELNSISAAGAQTGSKLGAALSGAFKAAAAAAAAVSAVVVKVGKDAFQAYGQFEQLVGGVNKLFDKSATTVLKNAQAAFKTAGMSANQYMDNVMKFSASLIQSLGGDTAKAASIADTAIKDMADNVNTFGSNIEDIQNAYQGFAKQNYTMLDNLRLGYGGTKKEMERLLADAEKISGIKYDISSFADVAQAIHVIQEEMAIAGTTTREAATTIEGSVATMEAAWQNLLIAMGSGEGVQQATSDLVQSITTVIKNSLPVIKEIAKGIPAAIGEAIREGIPQLDSAFGDLTGGSMQSFADKFKNIGVVGGAALLPLLQYIPIIGSAFSGIGAPIAAVAGALGLVFANSESLRTSLGDAFKSIAPDIKGLIKSLKPVIDAFGELAGQVGDSLAPIIRDTLVPTIKQLFENIKPYIPQITNFIKSMTPLITQIINTIAQLLPQLMPIFMQLIQLQMQMTSALMPIIITLLPVVTQLVQLIGQIASILLTVLQPVLSVLIGLISSNLQSAAQGINLVLSLLSSFMSFFMQVYSQVLNVIQSIVSWVTEKFTSLYTTVSNKITQIKDWITNKFTEAFNFVASKIETAKQKFGELKDGIVNKFNTLKDDIWNKIKGIVDFGRYIMEGIASGIKNNTQVVIDALFGGIKGAIDYVKNYLSISSPSKLMRDLIGENIMLGIGVGIEAGEPKLGATFEDSLASALAFDPALGYTATIDYSGIGSSARSGVNVVNQTVNLYETDPAAVAAVLENRQNAALGV